MAATSSGRPARRTGVRATASVDPALAELAPGFGGPQHRRVDESRRDGVDRDPLRGPNSRARDLVSPLSPDLDDTYGAEQRLATVRARRRDVDDAAPARLDHAGQHRLAAVEGAGEVDPSTAPTSRASILRKRANEAPVPALLTRMAGGPSRRRTSSTAAKTWSRSADIDGQTDRRWPPDASDVLGGRGGRLVVQVEDRDAVSVGGQAPADGQPDARPAAGDDGDAPAHS